MISPSHESLADMVVPIKYVAADPPPPEAALDRELGPHLHVYLIAVVPLGPLLTTAPTTYFT